MITDFPWTAGSSNRFLAKAGQSLFIVEEIGAKVLPATSGKHNAHEQSEKEREREQWPGSGAVGY